MAAGAVACSLHAGDPPAVESESDADTDADTDSDTDTDTDTDADLWDADLIMVDAWFGYDAETGTIVNGIVDGDEQPNLVLATVANHHDLATSAVPTQYCFLSWEIPEGPIAANDAFDSAYWLSFDLSDAPVKLWETGDCLHLGSFMGMPRDGQDVAEFAAELGMGFGMKPIEAVDPDALEDWEETWSDSQSESWDDAYSTFAGGAFTMLDRPPADADIMFAFEMDPKTRDVAFDGSTGTYVELATHGAAPTGWYASLVMYYFDE